MPKPMTIFGIGKKIAAPTLLYFIGTGYLSLRMAPHFAYPGPNALHFILGGSLITVGLLTNIIAARMMLREFKNKRLVTRGPYALAPNPMYGSFILLTVPGLSLLLNSWLALTTSLVMYLLFKHFIHEEERYLDDTFGEEYREYRKNVLLKFL